MLRKCALLVLIFSIVVSGADLDGDGFDSDPSEGEFQDCCDTVDDGCYDPYLVNPGAWEIPDNGQADRCIEGIDQLPASLPCDDIIETIPVTGVLAGKRGIYRRFIGALVTPADTEPGIYAMDICEFKDDDDDPSWGFARQENLIFALSDETRNGFDIGIVGPDINQASVVSSWGRIQPYNGKYFLAISTGLAYSQLDNTDANGGTITYGTYTTTNSIVQAIPEWSAGPNNGRDYAVLGASCGPFGVAEQALDSILARFSMQQPTNMGAFSIKMAMVDAKRNAAHFTVGTSATCTPQVGFGVITKNDTGTPNNRNIAYDKNGWLFSSYNPNTNFFEICNEYGAIPLAGHNTCPKTNYLLEFTGFYEAEYASDWIPVGTSATPGEPFKLKFSTWDRAITDTDTTLLLDDYIPIAEPRTYAQPYGYQFTSDVELTYLRPTLNGVYPAGTTQVTLNFVVKNSGPEQAGDLAINFTPPKGTRFSSTSWGDFNVVKPATGDYVNNSYYKYVSVTPLQVGQTRSGTITFDILAGHPNDLQFKVSVTCSSIETIFGNNYQIQQVYIDAPIY